MLRKFGCDWLSDKCSRIGKFSKIWLASSSKDFSKVGSDKIFLSLEPFAELEDFKMRIENVKSKSPSTNVNVIKMMKFFVEITNKRKPIIYIIESFMLPFVC